MAQNNNQRVTSKKIVNKRYPNSFEQNESLDTPHTYSEAFY